MGGEARRPYASLAGFYPSNPASLEKALVDSFLDKRFGPGSLPSERRGEILLVGGVVPHAGYSYSGPAAAHFYSLLASARRPDTIVIIGTNHTGYGGYYTTTTRWDEWATPLGTVKVDKEFIHALLDATSIVEDDYLAHLEEHSIEVQLPFLQYIYGDGFKIAPIVAKEVSKRLAKDMAAALREAAERTGRSIMVLASSDFTHHGYIYGYLVFTENIASNVEKLDMKVIDAILALDTDQFLRTIAETGATVCGVGAIAALMEYAKTRGRVEAKLLKYYNSAQLTGDEEVAVGYASIAIYLRE
ncbi:MAG: AmmeMemoRadiSam system protein B [Hyperthermus sp.]|nr:MAG: AmmeMemoRadiSam system protein B [Hyperthermus sp.]